MMMMMMMIKKLFSAISSDCNHVLHSPFSFRLSLNMIATLKDLNITIYGNVHTTSPYPLEQVVSRTRTIVHPTHAVF